jgi:DNA polymerase-1
MQRITSSNELRTLLREAKPNTAVIDLETRCASPECVNPKCKHALDPHAAKISEVAIAWEGASVVADGSLIDCLNELSGLLIFHNMKFDLKMLNAAGVDLRGRKLRDTMLMDHLADENRSHGLDDLVQARYGDAYKTEFWSKVERYEDATEADQLAYAEKDVQYTLRLYHDLVADLASQSIHDSLVDHVHRLALSLLDTEIAGVRIDLDFTLEMGSELKIGISALETSLREQGGWHCEILELQAWEKEIRKLYTPKGKKWQTLPKPAFNFSASGQVCELLYTQLGLPVVIGDKTKKPTADDKALESLEGKHPIIPEIRKLRKLSKMYGSFIEGVLDRCRGDRIYPSFNVNGTVTGRISHSDPNLGQMPSKGEWVRIRGIFVPEPGFKLVTCDYGMLEVCIAAHYSQDKNLLKIIHEGASKHDITAESLGVDRGMAKTLNFALQYQCSPRKVAEIMGCSKADGEYYWNKYWETYAGEKEVIEQCKRKVDKGEPIRNLFGRTYHMPSQFEKPWEREAAYRQAYSRLIQGTGSEFTSYSFYTVAEWLKGSGRGRAWFTVHDEILLETTAVAEARDYMSATMIEAGPKFGLTVPLTVSCSEGLDRWQK